MNRLLTFIFLLIITSCSTTKEPTTYEICVNRRAEKSKIINCETTKNLDTTSTGIKGRILDSNEKPIPYATLTLKGHESGKNHGVMTESTGEFSIKVPSNKYSLKLECNGYTTVTEKLKIKNGEVMEINFILGYGGGYETYSYQSEKELNWLQLKLQTMKIKMKY